MSQAKKILIVGILIIASVIGDQTTKYIATQNLEPYKTISYAGDTFRFSLSENSGGFLGLGGSLSAQTRFIIFSVFVSITLLALLMFVLLSSTLHRTWIIGLSFCLGGGLSNLIDRLLNNGVVVDFINVGIGSLRTGIFNVADMVIILGAVIIIINFNKKVEPEICRE